MRWSTTCSSTRCRDRSASPPSPCSGSAVVEISIAAGDLALTDEQLLSWVRRSATAVAGYYGRFPVPLVQLNIVTQGGSGVGHGLARPGRPPTISISVGEQATQRNL